MCKTKIEKAWLVASVIIFITHRLLDASYPGYDSPSAPLRLWLELAMIALSFPLGGLTLFALHGAASFWCDDCRSLEFLFDWSTLLFAGYIQWFWVLPEFLRNRKLTLLDLKLPAETISPHASPAAVEPATHAPPSPPPPAAVPSSPAAVLPAAAAVAAPCGAFDAAAFASPLAEFDDTGLTALGRVFQAQSPSPTRASHAHVEAIFPRVS